MTQLNTWAKSWGRAWGDSWGKNEETQTGHSGVTRLWMYELYSKAIEEDHNRKKTVAPVKKPRKAKKQPVFDRVQPTKLKREQVKVHYPTPYIAPVSYLSDTIEETIGKLPKLNTVLPIRKKVIATVSADPSITDVKEVEAKKRKYEEELLLLLAA